MVRRQRRPPPPAHSARERPAPSLRDRLCPWGQVAPSERTRVRREPQRGVYDRGDDRRDPRRGARLPPRVRPRRPPVRDPDALRAASATSVYVHGSSASRMLRTLDGGVDACLTVTLVDGHRARTLDLQPLDQLPVGRRARPGGRGGRAGREAARAGGVQRPPLPGPLGGRPPADRDGAEGDVDPAPAARRGVGEGARGPPKDDEDDYEWPVWAGVIPLALTRASRSRTRGSRSIWRLPKCRRATATRRSRRPTARAAESSACPRLETLRPSPSRPCPERPIARCSRRR